MTMRECWANVYVEDGEAVVGWDYGSRKEADENKRLGDRNSIVHIRLKPEGAPRRYSSERNRQQWETMPEEMRKCPF